MFKVFGLTGIRFGQNQSLENCGQDTGRDHGLGACEIKALLSPFECNRCVVPEMKPEQQMSTSSLGQGKEPTQQMQRILFFPAKPTIAPSPSWCRYPDVKDSGLKTVEIPGCSRFLA